jgi:hypothetical protein
MDKTCGTSRLAGDPLFHSLFVLLTSSALPVSNWFRLFGFPSRLAMFLDKIEV